jgi:L-alanine-DL-glutamate epimerase-like enolase superfamily enzyme
MKISRIEPIPVLVPLKKGMTTKTAHGEHIDSPYVLVVVHTSEGLIGYGEATLSPRWSGETSPGCVAAIRDVISPALEGADPRDVGACMLRIEASMRLNPFTKAAVEMAIWDIAGKAAKLPVYQLLGGKVRNSMPLKMVVGAFDIPRALSLAEQFLDWGVKHLKVKVGLDCREDMERVKAVRQLAGPDITIGIDGNCGWDLSTARRALCEMEQYDILFAEQPIGTDDPENLVQLRASTSIPLMADESAFTPNDAWHLTSLRAVDILSVYPGKNSGLLATMAISNLAEAAGIICSMGSNLELGIATAAMLHVGVAAPAIDSERYPGDFIGPLYHDADLIAQPLSLGPEVARVPEGPGLGVEIDLEQVESYRQK